MFNNRVLKRSFIVLIIAIIISNSLSVQAAQKGFKIQYNGKVFTYTKSTVNIVVDNKKVKTSMPGIIINGVSMVPVNVVFAKALKVNYQYNKEKKTVTLSNNKNKVVMTIKSKVAYINRKKSTTNEGPQIVKVVSSQKNYIMVPARFVAEALGYSYKWNNSTVTSTIISQVEDDSDQTGSDDTGEIIDGDTTNPKDESNNNDSDNPNNPIDPTKPANPADPTDPTTPIDTIPEEYSVKILRSEEITKGSITTTDDYTNRQFVITIPGDCTSFYNDNEPEIVDDFVDSITAQLDEYGNTNIYIKTSKVKAFIVSESLDSIYVTIKEPKEVYDRVVVLDAGHGGGDTGALGNSLIEKYLTLSIVKFAKSYLDTESNIKVYYTRLDDFEEQITKGAKTDPIRTTVESVIARYKFANETGADLFISVHMNAHKTSTPMGSEVYYSYKNSRTNEDGLSSKDLAFLCLPKIVNAVGSKNRNVKDGSALGVLRNTIMPAILIEVAFISNEQDAAILADPEKQDNIGYAIYDTIYEALNLSNLHE